jgi:hypothetical protein
MTRFLFLAALALGLLHALPARADDRPPRYDLDAHCSRAANTLDGFDVNLQQQCFRDQEDALAALKRIWEDTPVYIQDDCDQRARADDDQDYTLLYGCVRDLLSQADPNAVTPGQ